jgi:hypothetical protein
MALNRDKIGTEYPSYRYEVCREKIREYAAALGETDPRYFSDGDDCVAPPTFAACFTVIKGGRAAMSDADLGTHPALVHGSQSFEWHGDPVRPGQTLVCTPRIDDISYRGRNEFLTTAIECRDDDGAPVVTARQVVVFLGSAPDAATDAAAGATTQGGPA